MGVSPRRYYYVNRQTDTDLLLKGCHFTRDKTEGVNPGDRVIDTSLISTTIIIRDVCKRDQHEMKP